MNATRILAACSGILLASLMLLSQAAYAGVAGYAQFVNGSVQVESLAGQMRALQKGGAVNEGDTVISAQAASAQIRMQDGGFIAVRPDTRLKFDSFKFNGKQDGSERSFFSLFKGGFRAITGLIGQLNKSNYRITTAASTIGIRGTDHETYVVTPDSPLAKVTPVGTYNKVNVGETYMTTDKGTIFVLPNQMGFAGAADQMPQLKPLNTNIFTAAERPTREAKVDQKEAKEEATEVRATATVDNTAAAAAAAPAAEVATSSTGTNVETNILQPITTTNGTDLSGGAEDTASLALAAANQAQAAATAAANAASSASTSYTSLSGITPVSTAPATAAISTATSSINTAGTAVTAASALHPVSSATVTANASAAQTAATAAATQALAANNAFNSNGPFADATAGPANTAAQNANNSLQTANNAVQSAAATVAAQNAALATAQASASAALSSADSSLTAANTSLSTANTQNGAIGTAQGSVATQLTAAQTAAANAQTAATAAQAAATLAASLQQAGNLAGAQAQLVIAQQQLAVAQTEQANAQAAQTAVAAQLSNAQAAQTAASTAVTNATTAATTAATAAGTASTQAAAATTASTNANSALTTSATNLYTINSYAPIVAAKAPIAAYNNPAVASNNFIGHLAMPVPVVTGGGYNIGQEQNNTPQANTTFVLDGNGNLVEMRNTSFQIQAVQSTTPATSIASADVTWSGGTAADTFKLADNSIYAGRWSGATVTMTDLSTQYAPFTETPADSLWAVLLTPNSGYVQSLTGTTNYTMAGATKPFDTAGNLGTLTGATLSADFTNQLVNATLNLTMPAASSMAGTYAVTANGMPINTIDSGDPSGFKGNTPTVSCSGTCAAGTGGYSANVGGSFAGTKAASAGLGYDIWPTVSPGSPVTDLVQGLVAFATSTPPTVLTGGPFAAYASPYIEVESAGGFSFSSGMMAAPADLTYVTGTAGGASTSGALASAIFHDIGGGGNYTLTSTITGGTATSADATAFATTGIQYGAWTGYTGVSYAWSQSLGGKNGGAPDSWMYGPEGYVDASNAMLFSGTSAGTFTYQMDGATAPKSQNTGLTGVLNSASFTVNFAASTLTGNMALTMPGNENWGASVTNAPIAAGSPFNVTPVVTYGLGVPATSCPTCSGNVNGAFTGQNFAGAILSYDLYNNAAMGGGDVSGNVALTRNFTTGNTNPTVTNGAPAPTGNIVVATAGNGSGSSVSTYPVANSTTTGNLLTAYGSSSTGTGYSSSNSTTVTCSTCTTTASGDVTNSGIYYGTWDAGTYAQSTSATFPAGTMQPAYWITGPEAGPLYLPQALTGTATYTLDSGQVSNSMGVAGTVASTTALTLDFNKQTVGINLDVSIADTATPTPAVHTWNATTLPGNEAALGNGRGIGGAAFYASTYNNGSGSGLLTVSVDSGATTVTSPSGYVSGQLTGTGLTGAIMSFNLGGELNAATAPTYENINGVAAFTGPAQNLATPNQYVLMSLADPFSPVPLPVLGFNANAPSRITTDANGNLTQFDIQTINNNGGGSSTVTNASPTNVADYGTDPVSGISWGRWAGGTFNVTDRATGAVTPVTQTGSLHWITEPATTTAVTLPTTGTYTYTNAGGTHPTDNLGNVGTLNSATLSADFTAQTVNVGVNATVNGATLDAAGSNVPIIQNTVFYASSQEPAASTSHLAVTCAGSCGAAQGGIVIGKFVGAGAIGAAVSYGLQNGANTISGVTAFHR